MDLSLFHNGQFFVALVEYKTEGKSINTLLVQNQTMNKY
jgi:hypothetical protein